MKTITTPHVPTKVDFSKENPTSTCENCSLTIEQFTWYDDDCGWRTERQWHYATWVDGRSPGVKVARFHYECESV
jgi:hypothetical protein